MRSLLLLCLFFFFSLMACVYYDYYYNNTCMCCCSAAVKQPPALPPSSSSMEVAALLAFKTQLRQVSIGRLSEWTDADTSACTWWRVRCDDESRVIALTLQDLGLQGPLSAELAQLAHLTHLNLSANELTGPIPPQLSRLQRLTHLDLHQNNLTGPIPAELSQCRSLLLLDLSYNTLSGTIPPSLGKLRSLRIIQLHHIPLLTGPLPLPLLRSLRNLTHLCLGTNNLTGALPPELSLLSNLQDLALYENPNVRGPIPMQLARLRFLRSLKLFKLNLTATSIPVQLGNLSSLEFLYLFDSSLEGTIPPDLGNLSRLKKILLGQNRLTGPVPASLGRLTELTELNLFGNMLHGTIPPHLGNLSSLASLFLQSNQLSHALPPELGNLHRLTDLHIYINNLSGPLPPELGRLNSLLNLYAFSNKLHGRLPPELGNLTRLRKMSLGANSLIGSPIPPELGRMRSLRVLDLSSNQLAGEIPSSFGNLSRLLYLKLQDNHLRSQLPASLAKCAQLRWLKIENNFLEGKIPREYFAPPARWRLHTLSLSGNKLGGELPAELASLAGLVVLNLGKNSFSGRIPEVWRAMINLCVLNLGGNRLVGDIPGWIWSLRYMKVLDLSNNELTGSIPPQIEGFTSLRSGQLPPENKTLWDDYTPVTCKGAERWYSAFTLAVIASIDLARNRLSGIIPPGMGGLTALFNLNLSGNDLRGPIPHTLGALHILESLDLSFNNLCGDIPHELADIQTLEVFNVSYNRLSGRIPRAGRAAQFPFSESSYKGDMDLCGEPLFDKCDPIESQHISNCSITLDDFGDSKMTKKRALIVVAASILTTLALVCFMWLAFKCRRRHLQKCKPLDLLHISDKDLYKCRSELLNLITMGCNEDNKIGVGGVCVVHKFTLSSGRVIVVKKLNRRSNDESEAMKSFSRESKILGCIKHRNIIRLLGVYSLASGGTCLACILDFKSNGTLDDHLHHIDETMTPLTWAERLNIAIGIAQAILYLHNESGYGEILHLDLKPSNILLDDDKQPCICDFGNALIKRRFGWSSMSQTHLLGTIGYIAPERAQLHATSDKADVYSFGVILLEMITGKRPIAHEPQFNNENEIDEAVDLRRWVIESLSMMRDVCDPLLQLPCISSPCGNRRLQASAMIQIALSCTIGNANDRPTIKKVLKMIHNCTKLPPT